MVAPCADGRPSVEVRECQVGAVYTRWPGRVLLIGCGAIGRVALALVLRHVALDRANITVIDSSPCDAVVREWGIRFLQMTLDQDNFRQTVSEFAGVGGFVLNLAGRVSGPDILAWCQEIGAIYLDSSIEEWGDGTTHDPECPVDDRSLYGLHRQVRALGRSNGPTALVTHGANPGLVSHFVKAALATLGGRTPAAREDWALLARGLGIKTIHVSERDWQQSDRPRGSGEFVNTWSIDCFLAEAAQPPEVGWGTHEAHWPPRGRHHCAGAGEVIYLDQRAAGTRVRSWAPRAGAFHGLLLPHSEAITLAEYFTLGAGTYRPTVLFAYRPCDEAMLSLMEAAETGWQAPKQERLLQDEIVRGEDELGVLLGSERGAYWYGSALAVDEARRLVPGCNATTLQVAAGVLGGAVWAMENPARGLVFPEDIDHHRVLEVAVPYLGNMRAVFTDWTPLANRDGLFPDETDDTDAWQFKNVLIS